MTDNKVGCNGRPPKAMYRIVKWLEFDFIAEHLKDVKSFVGYTVLVHCIKKKSANFRMMSFYSHRLQISFAMVKIRSA